MRVPLMPLALSLAVGGLLYAAYQGNTRLVENPTAGPGLASRAARANLEPAQASTAAAPQKAGDQDAAATLQEADAGDQEVDMSRLDERCAAIAATAAASAGAIESEVPLEEFLRRPVVAFVSDPSLRSELERVARSVYDRPTASSTVAQRIALREARCP